MLVFAGALGDEYVTFLGCESVSAMGHISGKLKYLNSLVFKVFHV
jgi:hypothetical protein